MSSSLRVYLLDVAATRALVGSRDDQLLEVISDRLRDRAGRPQGVRGTAGGRPWRALQQRRGPRLSAGSGAEPRAFTPRRKCFSGSL
ncbi:DUF7691 family protein [Streptomyces chartreusis]|uniref:DUF7691 family protein n=1 Tax=Streptomyces chartreusis TaxID=1969 RepID=UPI003D73FDEC